MRTFKSVLLAAAALPLASAIVVPSRIFDSISSLPRGWTHHREPAHDEELTLRVYLREQNMDQLEKLFWDISDPGHASYGKHFEANDLHDMIRPSEESAGAVVDWLKAHDVSKIYIDDKHISFVTNVATANKMLNTDFNWYRNDERNEAHMRTTKYSVPPSIAGHINYISPTLKFPNLHRMKSTINKVGQAITADILPQQVQSTVDSIQEGGLNAASSATCGTTVTPQCLLNLYNVHYAAKSNSKVAFASFLNEYARYSDLSTFESSIAPYAKGKNFSVVSFANGGNDQGSSDDSVEANLDNQYVVSVGYPLDVIEYSTAGCGPLIPDPNEAAGSCSNEPYADFLNGMLALSASELPSTLSISYGEDEQTWPLADAVSVCNQFMQLGARGVSVLIASGDSGPGAICENNDGSKAQFVPNFPASCPYLTTVGATYKTPTEQAIGFSGGGFSNYFAQPSYQSTAVNKYISSLGSKFDGYYNKSGRAYPDVSAQGSDFAVVDGGLTEPVSGTSASTPAFSAVIALLNSARIASGNSTLGFLNPFLYGAGAAGLTDITSGSSTGCSSGSKPISGAGFAAVAGWDASTGLGTPNFGKLLAIAAPNECNVGGPVPNPSISSCAGQAAATSSSVAKTYSA